MNHEIGSALASPGMNMVTDKVPTPMHEDERLALDRETMVSQRAESLEGELKEARSELQRLTEEYERVANSYSRMLEATQSHVDMLERALGYDQPDQAPGVRG